MKLRCEELQELTFEKEKIIEQHQEKLKSKDSETEKQLDKLQD
jgi:hypothetical protein